MSTTTATRWSTLLPNRELVDPPQKDAMLPAQAVQSATTIFTATKVNAELQPTLLLLTARSQQIKVLPGRVMSTVQTLVSANLHLRATTTGAADLTTSRVLAAVHQW
jgi:hypothetical protein